MGEAQDKFALSLAVEDPEYESYLKKLGAGKKKRVQTSLARMRHGLHAVAPIVCNGPARCPFVAHCPIPSVKQKQEQEYGPASDYPMLMPCVLETMYQRQKIIEYVQHLEVDPENPVEMSLVNELAIQDMYKNRALMIMSGGDRDGDGRDFLRQDDDWKEVGDGAELIKRTVLHPVFDVLDRIERRRERLLERLLQTRKSQAEIALKQGKTAEDSNLLEELRKIGQYLQLEAGKSIGGDAVLIDD